MSSKPHSILSMLDCNPIDPNPLTFSTLGETYSDGAKSGQLDRLLEGFRFTE